ncbi:MAG: class I SAM-dependent methyltransferase [Arenicellales bacterium]
MSEQSPRFGFGRNWMQYARLVDEPKVAEARASLSSMLDRETLGGLSFLDIGTGSGLFSLAARRLGARVRGFDFDPDSVACTRALRDRFDEAGDGWDVEQGSILDVEYVKTLGSFDVVYAWGVLHHTGAMWQALDQAAGRVADNGMLYVALYNHQGWLTRYWRCVKRMYNRNVALRWILTAVHAPYFVALRWLVRRMTGKRSPERGMTLWYDMKDWLGGYPFEAATPDAVLAFLRPRGFQLDKLTTCGGRHGCNEYLFTRRRGG